MFMQSNDSVAATWSWGWGGQVRKFFLPSPQILNFGGDASMFWGGRIDFWGGRIVTHVTTYIQLGSTCISVWFAGGGVGGGSTHPNDPYDPPYSLANVE